MEGKNPAPPKQDFVTTLSEESLDHHQYDWTPLSETYRLLYQSVSAFRLRLQIHRLAQDRMDVSASRAP